MSSKLEAKKKRLEELRKKRKSSVDSEATTDSMSPAVQSTSKTPSISEENASVDSTPKQPNREASPDVPVPSAADNTGASPAVQSPLPSPSSPANAEAPSPSAATEASSLPVTSESSSSSPSTLRRTSGTSFRRELALKTAKLTRLTGDLNTWKEKYQNIVQQEKSNASVIQELKEKLSAQEAELVCLRSDNTVQAAASNQDTTSAVESLEQQLKDNAAKYLKDLHAAREEARASSLQLEEVSARLEKITAEADTKGEQLIQLGEMLLTSGGMGGGAINLELIMERFAEQQKQCADYEIMLDEATAEIEALKSAHDRKDNNRGAIESVLDDYEAQHAELMKELNRLKAIEAEYKDTKESRSRAVETWQAKAHETEALLEQSRKKEKSSAEEVTNLRKQLSDARSRSQDASSHSSAVTKDLEAQEEKIEQLLLREKDLQSELDRVIEQAHYDTERMEQEIETQKTIAVATKVELEQIRHAAVTDVEAVKIALHDQKNDLVEARVKAKKAKDELMQLEESHSEIIKELKEEVLAATGNMEGAALAGLGLQEIIAKMKEDHNSTTEKLHTDLELSRSEHEKSKMELADISAQLEERNAMLTGVMEFMQNQQAGAEEEGDIPEGEDTGGLQGMLERSARLKEALEASLAEFEEENARLSQSLAKSNNRIGELERGKRKVEEELESTTRSKDNATSELSEKSKLLERIMGMVKKRGDSHEEPDRSEDTLDVNDPLSGIASLEEQIRSLLEANRGLENDKAKLELDLAQLHESSNRLQELCDEQKDEMEVLSGKVLELAEATAVGESLKKMLNEGEQAKAKLREENAKLRETIVGLEKERSDLQDELATTKAELQSLRDELEQSLADVSAAAEGGLTLMEMLNKLKSDHEAEIENLNMEIAELERKLEEKDAQMARLAEMLPGDEADISDALSTLELRLKRQVAEAEAMAATIAEYETKIDAQAAEIQSLKSEIGSLKAKILDLEHKLADAVEELQNLNTGIKEAFSKSRKPGSKKVVEDEEELDDEPQAVSLSELLDSIDMLTALVETREGELETALEKNAELSEAYSEALGRIKSLEDELETERERSADLEKALDRMTKKHEATEDRLTQMTKYRDELSAENKKLIEQLEKMKKLRDKEGKQTAATIADLNRRLADRHERIQHLEGKLLEKITELTATQAFLRKIALRTWEDDTRAEECTNCDESFSLMLRRHHCRICGKVFCKNCSRYKVQTTAKKKPVRSCHECFKYMEVYSLHDNKLSLQTTAFDEKKIEITKDVTGRNGFDVSIAPEMPPLKGVIVLVNKVDASGIATGKLCEKDRIVSINGISTRELSEKKAFHAMQADKLTLLVHRPTEGPDVEGDNLSLDGEDGSDEDDGEDSMSPSLSVGKSSERQKVSRNTSSKATRKTSGSDNTMLDRLEKASVALQVKKSQNSGQSSPSKSQLESKSSNGSKILMSKKKALSSPSESPASLKTTLPNFEELIEEVQIQLVKGRTLGITFGNVGGVLVTRKVADSGLAHETGKVVAGMKVVSINGQKTAGMNKQQCAQAIEAASETLDLGLCAPVESWSQPAVKRPNTHKFQNSVIEGPPKPKPGSLPLTLYDDDDEGEEESRPKPGLTNQSDDVEPIPADLPRRRSISEASESDVETPRASPQGSKSVSKTIERSTETEVTDDEDETATKRARSKIEVQEARDRSGSNVSNLMFNMDK